MFTEVLFILDSTWKQHIYPQTKEWIRKMWYIYTTEYYSAVKNDYLMKFAGKWMELEKNIMSDETQTQKGRN